MSAPPNYENVHARRFYRFTAGPLAPYNFLMWGTGPEADAQARTWVASFPELAGATFERIAWEDEPQRYCRVGTVLPLTSEDRRICHACGKPATIERLGATTWPGIPAFFTSKWLPICAPLAHLERDATTADGPSDATA